MQTFLPYPVYRDSARVLDRKRLGSQRKECLQLVRALLVPGAGWSNHPAAKMWLGHVASLCQYGIEICREWVYARGYKDSCMGVLLEYKWKLGWNASDIPPAPPWLGREDFHSAHRSNLLRKDPSWYGKFDWSESHGLPYVWPV